MSDLQAVVIDWETGVVNDLTAKITELERQINGMRQRGWVERSMHFDAGTGRFKELTVRYRITEEASWRWVKDVEP